MCNHSEPSSSSIVQFVPSQCRPFLLVSVVTWPSDPAQAASQSCDPQRPIAIELKMLDSSGLTRSMSGRVRRAELAILEIRYSPVAPETEPHSAPLSEYLLAPC